MKITTNILITTLASLLLSGFAVGQGVGINAAGAPPDNSAILEAESTDKGVLTPRMTEGERLAIASPATGLLVYQTDGRPGFRFYDGTEWLFMRGMTSVPGRVEVASGCITSVVSPSAYTGFSANFDCDLGSGTVTWPAGIFDNQPVVNITSSVVPVPPPAPDIYCIPVYSAPCYPSTINMDQITGVRVYESTTGVGGTYNLIMERLSGCDGDDNGNYYPVPPGEAACDMISNYNGCSDNWYRVDVQSSTQWNDYVQAFVDWNADGDFFDAQENLDPPSMGASGTGGAWLSSPEFEVPDGTLDGNLVMRVRSTWVQSSDPCQGATWGETEDYTITIVCGEVGPAPEITSICTVTDVTTTSFDYSCTLLSGSPADPPLVNFDLVPME